MANKGHQNVTPLNCRDPERARQIQSMGGKAASEKMRRKRSLREAFYAVQDLEVDDPDGIRMPASDAIALALVRKCIDGDLKAIELLWEALYGKQSKVDVTSSDGSMSPAKIDLSGLSREDLKAVAREAFGRREQGTA